VKTADCGVLETLVKGDVKVRLTCGTQSIMLVLRDCLHAPSAPINLISVGAMQEQWHCCLGHLGIDVTRAILTKNYATGVDWSGAVNFSDHCIPCLIGKHPQQPYSHNHNCMSAVCKLLHMDTCGPFPVLTSHKKSSFWVILNDKSNYGHIVVLAARNDVYDAYWKVESPWEAKSGNHVVAVHMDGAKELCLGHLEEHFTSCGIAMQVTAPYAHSQNGKIECYIRTIKDGFQTLLADSGLSMTFWGDTALTMNYFRNWVPTLTLPNDITPCEEMEHVKPNLAHLWVWGCQCFVAIPQELHTKGGPCCFEAIFVGYEDNCIR